MLEKTNMDAIKDIAKTLLYTDIHVDDTFDFLCHHPFFQTTATFDMETHKLLDLTKEKDLEKARKMMEKQIDKATSYAHLFMMVQKPYYPALFKYSAQYLGEKDFADALAYTWTTTEFPNHDANVSLNEFLNMFKKANKEYLMNEECLDAYNALPDKITVYRGTCLQSTTKAMSWTTDVNKARWFAERFGDNGKVYEAQINKKDIFAYFADSGEKEIVLNYKKLENIREIENLSHDRGDREDIL